MATTNVADRLVNLVQSAFAQISDGSGLAEGGLGMGAGMAVISGSDHRTDDAYVNQLFLTNSGGPASPTADGWLTYGLPVAAGLMYRDSVEIDELKHPMEVRYLRMVPGTGGAPTVKLNKGEVNVNGAVKDRLPPVVARTNTGGCPGAVAITTSRQRRDVSSTLALSTERRRPRRPAAARNATRSMRSTSCRR